MYQTCTQERFCDNNLAFFINTGTGFQSRSQNISLK